MGRSKYRCNKAHGPTVAVKSSNDVSRERLQAQSYKNAVTLNFSPKMGINAFSTGICLAKCLTHNISTTMRDRAIMVSPIGNYISEVQWSRDWWRHVTLKGQGRDPQIFEAQYLNNRARYMVTSYWLPIGNHTLGIQWSHYRWRHVTRKVKVVTPIPLELNISTTVRSRRTDGGLKLQHLRETIYCQFNGHVTDDVTSRELKGQCCEPKIFEAL